MERLAMERFRERLGTRYRDTIDRQRRGKSGMEERKYRREILTHGRLPIKAAQHVIYA